MPLTAFSSAAGVLACRSRKLVAVMPPGSPVTVVHLVGGLGAGDLELGGVDDDDEVTGIDVKSV